MEYALQLRTTKPTNVSNWWIGRSDDTFLVESIYDAKRMSKEEAEQELEELQPDPSKPTLFIVPLD